MKKTLQKKLDDLGDRLRSVKPTSTTYKVKGRIRSVKKGMPLVGYINSSDHFPDSYDLRQKGLQFDALKKEHEALQKRNNELVKFCNSFYTRLHNSQVSVGGDSSFGDTLNVMWDKDLSIGEKLLELILNNK